MACLGTMYVLTFLQTYVWISIIISVLGIITGNAFSEVDRCISNMNTATSVLKTDLCVASKDDIKIMCKPDEVIVLESLHFAIKPDENFCTKRVLSERDGYCCKVQDSDVLYDDRCLLDVWSTEDKIHHQQFMQRALRKCMGTHYCTLDWEMFSNLQRKLPTTQKYASYLQVRNRCMKAPTDPVNMCSSTAKNGKFIHLQETFSSRDNLNKNCSCRVTSQSPVTVRAVDVRTYDSRLILRSDNRDKDITSDQLPMFGHREIFTGRPFDILLQKVSDNTNDYLWLQLTASNREEFLIVCGDQKAKMARPAQTDMETKVWNTPRDVDPVTTSKSKSAYKSSTLMIYAGVGSGLTLILTVFIFGCYFICRYCSKKGNKRHQYENPYPSHIPGQYDAVYDSLPHRSDHVIAPEWGNVDMKQNQRTSTMRSLHKPMAPTLPPPNKHGLVPSDHTQLPNNPMTASTTSDFEWTRFYTLIYVHNHNCQMNALIIMTASITLVLMPFFRAGCTFSFVNVNIP